MFTQERKTVLLELLLGKSFKQEFTSRWEQKASPSESIEQKFPFIPISIGMGMLTALAYEQDVKSLTLICGFITISTITIGIYQFIEKKRENGITNHM